MWQNSPVATFRYPIQLPKLLHLINIASSSIKNNIHYALSIVHIILIQQYSLLLVSLKVRTVGSEDTLNGGNGWPDERQATTRDDYLWPVKVGDTYPVIDYKIDGGK